MQAFVSKTRRPKFELTLKIIDLNNVPLVSGTSFIKWHLPHSTSAEHRGRTAKCYIKDHKVQYNYEQRLAVRLTVDKTGTLSESEIHFDVVQEYSAGSRAERITLGHIKLNLAEYVEQSSSDGEDGISRRYLMQDSKINSTLKISIGMRLTEGERNFVAPALKSAPVFGGIAGIMSAENGDGDESGLPSITSNPRENGSMQDVYRTNLAAYWTAQPGELKPDECIEDIFAGGDGWADTEDSAMNARRDSPERRTSRRRPGSKDPDLRSRSRSRDSYNQSSYSAARGGKNANKQMFGGMSGQASLEQHANTLKAEAERSGTVTSSEVDEFDIREDLHCWKIDLGDIKEKIELR